MKQFKQILALCLTILMIFNALPIVALAADTTGSSPVVVIAGSDFQDPDDGSDTSAPASCANVSAILTQIKKDYASVDGLIFCGDYDKDLPSKGVQNSTNALKNTVKAAFSGISNFFLVQGNHDQVTQGTNGLTGPGAHDTDDYGVYIIDEDDYQWGSGANSTKINETAAKLASYLTAKALLGYDKPIFVASHVPLHFSPRTQEGDGKYAKYIFDVLQAAGEAGLKIIFLYGHDHSQGWDNYMGGAAVYLPEGHDINVAQVGSGTKYDTYQLKFTYMNAGFVGYYADWEPDTDYKNTNSGVDKSLTMTVFEITDSEVTIKRYDANGVHNLKSEGKENVKHTDRTQCPLMTDVIASGQVIKLPATSGEETPETPTTLTDASTGISLRGAGVTSFTVSSMTVADAVLGNYGIKKYVAYDFNVPGFVSGTEVTVGIPVPAGWNTDATYAYYINGDKLERLPTHIENGVAYFPTTHFSGYLLGEEEGGVLTWYTIPGGKYASGKLTSLNNGDKVIIQSNQTTSLYLSGSTNNNNRMILTSVSSTTNPANSVEIWTVEISGSNYYLKNSKGLYLTIPSDGQAYVTNYKTALTIDYAGSSKWTIKQTTTNYYLNQYGGYGTGNTTAAGWYQADNGSMWNFYRVYDNPDTYAAFTPAVFRYPVGTFENTAQVEAAIRDLITVYTSENSDGSNKTAVTDYTLTGSSSFDPTVATSSDGVNYTISYKNVTLGTVNVVIYDKTPVSISIDKDEASVYRKASASTKTGVTVTVTYDDGSSETVDLTVGMLSGEDLDINTANEDGKCYTTTVTYKGLTLDDFKLTVLPLPNEVDYPEYPNEGSVIVNKIGSGVDFQSSGVAEIELSAKGIPAKRHVDVIVMVDTSSSMKYGAYAQSSGSAASGSQRIDYLRNSLKAMLKSFTAVNEDGTHSDIRLALADFNGYTSNSASNGWPISGMNTIGDATANRQNRAEVFTGNKTISAGALEQVGDYTDEQINTLVSKVITKSGTNFDYAFDTIYRMAYDIKKANEENGEEREMYVIFMSDGCPYSYNYYIGGSSGNDGTNWSRFLMGAYTAQNVPANNNTNFKSFYNAETGNTHRMADAIKGDEKKSYVVISPTNDLPGSTAATGYNNNYMYTVNGLGVTMYSIGFCIYSDNNVTAEAIGTTISRIASDEDHYFNVQGADQDSNVQARLDNAFTQISSEMLPAATGARFIDTMGEDYDIQLATKSYEVIENGQPVSKTITPKIVVKAYTVHKRSEFLDGTITEDKIGTRTDAAPEILETVTFNENGTEAYSNKLSGNIRTDGVIRAKTFYYNTTNAAVTVTIGSENVTIPPETFYWIIGDLGEKEMVLSYYVYLTGSLEGTRPAGHYPTNESATLYYTNWLGNEAHKDTVSPVMPWQEATVSYAFYLVDENGNPVNQMGDKSSFANRTALTQPVVYQTIYLNSTTGVAAELVAKDLIPAGLTLYDSGAEFDITVTSDGVNSSWDITQGSGSGKATTYVTDYHGTDFSNDTNEVKNPAYDYSHTVVWFAVKAEIKCVPDVVVVDFGLPVDIHVLANDMFGSYGKLKRIVNVSDVTDMVDGTSPRHAEAVTTSGLDLNFGSAALGTDVITYTLNTMSMYEVETFAYEVQYTNTTAGLDGYYYGTVTVVPATIIYYEDGYDTAGFVTFTGNWEAAGSAEEPGKKQGEDRPGLYSINSIDANNIYGYDPVYGSCNTFSLGNAKKVTVATKAKDASWPTATFTFTGTGFDLISVTSKDTGLIKVDIYKTGEIRTVNGKTTVEPVTETLVKSWAVDTFYGYKPTTQDGFVKSTWTYLGTRWTVSQEYTETAGESQTFPAVPKEGDQVITYEKNYNWTVTTDTDNALYQIPVIKCYNKLDYAQYKVVVTPTYSKLFQHNGGTSYDYYFDAVRIYNPANTSSDAKGYYLEDNEGYPQYIEVRESLLKQSDFDTFDGTTPISGAVFIDGIGINGDISEYTSFGPNNEVYLQPGQSIAFTLNVADKDNLASVQLGAKCVNGAAAYQIRSYDAAGKKVADAEKALNTATDMFYDVTKSVTWASDTDSNTIVLTNTGDSILSITQIKLTYKADPTPKAPARMLMTRSAAMLTVSSMNREYIDEHTEVVTEVVTEPATEPATEPVTEPETEPEKDSKKTKKEAEKAAKEAAKAAEKAAKEAAEKALKEAAKAAEKAVKEAAKAVKKAAETVSNVLGGVLNALKGNAKKNK